MEHVHAELRRIEARLAAYPDAFLRRHEVASVTNQDVFRHPQPATEGAIQINQQRCA